RRADRCASNRCANCCSAETRRSLESHSIRHLRLALPPRRKRQSPPRIGAMKQRSRNLDYLVYLIVRFVVAVLQALPFGAALRFADGLAWLAYRINKRHRNVADENLRHAFGDQYSDAERARLVRAVYRHFCRVVIEMMHLPRLMHGNTFKRHLSMG